MILVLLTGGIFFVALAATVLAGPQRFMRGTHVSRAVVRCLGFSRALTVRTVLAWVGLPPFVFFGLYVPYLVVTAIVAVWALDDWLFPDDDRKKRYRWARVRLRMPKPIKLRAVERWETATA